MKIKAKADFNFLAAERLIKENLYAPSVHCSYYSCFQMLKYVINDFCGIEYNKLDTDIIRSKQTTHKYVINYVVKELRNFDTFVSRKLKNDINDLKQFRIESDYHNTEVNFEKGQKAYDKANEIRQKLNQYFHV